MDRICGTDMRADAAADARLRVDHGNVPFIEADGVHWTIIGTQTAADAGFATVSACIGDFKKNSKGLLT
jgi:hypothetical protein